MYFTNFFVWKFLTFISIFFANFTSFWNTLIFNFVSSLRFLKQFYNLIDLVWQEGLLVDFLQKKVIDNWIKKFLIFSSYLFNERFLFEKTTRFFLDLLIWPAHSFLLFDVNSVSSMFFLNIFFFILLFITTSFFFFL